MQPFKNFGRAPMDGDPEAEIVNLLRRKSPKTYESPYFARGKTLEVPLGLDNVAELAERIVAEADLSSCLLVGVPGVGKSTLALQIVKALSERSIVLSVSEDLWLEAALEGKLVHVAKESQDSIRAFEVLFNAGTEFCVIEDVNFLSTMCDLRAASTATSGFRMLLTACTIPAALGEHCTKIHELLPMTAPYLKTLIELDIIRGYLTATLWSNPKQAVHHSTIW